MFAYLASLDLHVADLASTPVHGVPPKHALGYIQADNLLAVEGADDLPGAHCCIHVHDEFSVVFVRTAVDHALGTLMPYPSEDPPRSLEAPHLEWSVFHRYAQSRLPNEGGIQSISTRNPCRAGLAMVHAT